MPIIIEIRRIIRPMKQYGSNGIASPMQRARGLREKWNDYLDRKGIPRKGNGTLNKGE